MGKSIVNISFILIIVFSNSCKQENGKFESKNDFKFVFITDIHLQNELNATDGFIKAIDSINKINPDFVITGGDLVMDVANQTFERSDSLFNLYSTISKKIKMPIFNTIGNHDVFGYYKECGIKKNHPEFGKKMFEHRIGKTYYRFQHKNWQFFILDAIEITDSFNYAGKIDSVQVLWLKNQLDSIDENSPIVIVTHMPFITTFLQVIDNPMLANNETLVVQNSKQVLELFKNHNLKLVLQGHTHFFEDIFVNNIRFITSGAICGKWWKGSNFGTEEGFILFDFSDNSFTYNYIDYGWKTELQ
ncbi:MAG: metallophosphoesterase [Bacteroidales bacterium]|nr:metallophosphoesterase [Bacteroidales bacterium]MBN2755754.1 metallophosphoesterase [Bacteroidales bacterium]